jgi:hypothetical protein
MIQMQLATPRLTMAALPRRFYEFVDAWRVLSEARPLSSQRSATRRDASPHLHGLALEVSETNVLFEAPWWASLAGPVVAFYNMIHPMRKSVLLSPALRPKPS